MVAMEPGKHALASVTTRLLPAKPRDYIVITMKARLVRIGNSRGVRLPKAVIEQVGLRDDVELQVEHNRIVITSAAPPRTGWAEAARQLAVESRGLLDAPSRTRFDEDEWQW
jgi:antitoxin MazE